MGRLPAVRLAAPLPAPGRWPAPAPCRVEPPGLAPPCAAAVRLPDGRVADEGRLPEGREALDVGRLELGRELALERCEPPDEGENPPPLREAPPPPRPPPPPPPPRPPPPPPRARTSSCTARTSSAPAKMIADTRFIVAPICLELLSSALEHGSLSGGPCEPGQYSGAVHLRPYVRSSAT